MADIGESPLGEHELSVRGNEIETFPFMAKDQFVEVALLPIDEGMVEITTTVILSHLAKANAQSKVAMRVEVDHKDTILQRRECGGQVDRQSGLADTAF